MPNSVSDAVGAAAAAAVAAIGITAGSPAAAVPVVRRKTPGVPEGTAQGLPQFVVSVGTVPGTEYLTATQKLRKYPVAVTVVTNTGQQAADDPVIRQWRDQIDAALDTIAAFTGVTGFNQVDAGGGAPFDVSALSKDYDYSVQTFVVSVIEPRT